MSEFDAIVVGSGMSGGWVAKELCEKGLKVLVLERGHNIDPAKDYTDMLDPWDRKNFDRIAEDELKEHYPVQGDVYALHESTKQFWVRDSDHPYESADGKPFRWLRGFHLGGRSIMWGRLSYRFSPMDFEANAKDGHGVDWPIRYDDLAPWYDYVETFAGISGTKENLPQLPDGKFLPPFELNAMEKFIKAKVEAEYPGRRLIPGRVANLRRATEEHTALGRAQCQARNHCYNGCSFGAYFSALSATLPAAERTGNLTIVTDAIVQSVDYDPKTKRVTGVKVVNRETKVGKTYAARMVFLNASTVGTALILLQSKSEAFPNGLANSSDQVGRNMMDHVSSKARITGTYSGLKDRYYFGRRPNVAYLVRYGNLNGRDQKNYERGFAFQIYSSRAGWTGDRPGIGADFKQANRNPGDWLVTFDCFGEVLPNPENRVMLHKSKTDKWGMALPYFDAVMGRNEHAIVKAATRDAVEMMEKIGLENISRPKPEDVVPTEMGDRIHEMGTARMGRDPKTSVLNGWNQSHDVANLFITDGACMTSSAVQNPSLTYMAISARAANHAAELLKEGLV
jgi:choline dehydrogenase-like flavoprotein